MSHTIIPAGTINAGRTIFPARTGIPRRTGTTDPGAQVASAIERFGFHLVHVGDACDCRDCDAAPLPPDQRFGYTIGLTELGQPELLVRGLSARESAEVLDRWAATVLAGQVFDAGHLLCEGSGGPTWELVPVRNPARTLLWADRYYPAAELSALELIPARRSCPCQWCS